MDPNLLISTKQQLRHIFNTRRCGVCMLYRVERSFDLKWNPFPLPSSVRLCTAVPAFFPPTFVPSKTGTGNGLYSRPLACVMACSGRVFYMRRLSITRNYQLVTYWRHASRVASQLKQLLVYALVLLIMAHPIISECMGGGRIPGGSRYRVRNEEVCKPNTAFNQGKREQVLHKSW